MVWSYESIVHPHQVDECREGWCAYFYLLMCHLLFFLSPNLPDSNNYLYLITLSSASQVHKAFLIWKSNNCPVQLQYLDVQSQQKNEPSSLNKLHSILRYISYLKRFIPGLKNSPISHKVVVRLWYSILWFPPNHKFSFICRIKKRCKKNLF